MRTSLLYRENGIALMLTLWVMVFLTIVATQFALSAKTEVRVVGNYVEEVKCYYLAKAGIALAIAEISNPDNKFSYIDGKSRLMFGRAGKKDAALNVDSKESTVDPNKDNMAFGGGHITYKIEDEGGKIPINILAKNRDVKKISSLLALAGVKEGGGMDTLAESIIDWVDNDDLHLLNGAENDYYRSLDPPYDCKNGPIDIFEEMLLIQGMTREIFEKLTPLISVFSNTSKDFNPNTASCEIYKVWLNLEDDEKCAERFDDSGLPKNKKLSSVYTIVSVGKFGDDLVKRTVKAVIKNSGDGKNRLGLKYLFWNDNFIPSEKKTKK